MSGDPLGDDILQLGETGILQDLLRLELKIPRLRPRFEDILEITPGVTIDSLAQRLASSNLSIRGLPNT
jgi:hypothetical protein